MHPAHWLISTQLPALRVRGLEQHAAPDREARRRGNLGRDAVAGPAHRGSMRTDRYVGSCLTSASARRSWQDRRSRCLALRTSTKAHLDVPVSGDGQPFGRQFACVRAPNARAPSGIKVHLSGQPLPAAFCVPRWLVTPTGRCTAFPCQETLSLPFKPLMRTVHPHARGHDSANLGLKATRNYDGRHPSADACSRGARWVVRL